MDNKAGKKGKTDVVVGRITGVPKSGDKSAPTAKTSFENDTL